MRHSTLSPGKGGGIGARGVTGSERVCCCQKVWRHQGGWDGLVDRTTHCWAENVLLKVKWEKLERDLLVSLMLLVLRREMKTHRWPYQSRKESILFRFLMKGLHFIYKRGARKIWALVKRVKSLAQEPQEVGMKNHCGVLFGNDLKSSGHEKQ